MPLAQAMLDFTARHPAPPSDQVVGLVQWLATNPGWHTAKQLATHLDLSDRQIRSLAEASNGLIVSGPGTPGYCHASHCTAEEIAHATDTLISQAKRMLHRAIRIRRRAHSIIR
jgi:hypothetical protein